MIAVAYLIITGSCIIITDSGTISSRDRMSHYHFSIYHLYNWNWMFRSTNHERLVYIYIHHQSHHALLNSLLFTTSHSFSFRSEIQLFINIEKRVSFYWNMLLLVINHTSFLVLEKDNKTIEQCLCQFGRWSAKKSVTMVVSLIIAFFDHNICSVNDHKWSGLVTISTWNERLHSRSFDHVNQNIDLVKIR
jgi:hypothetical protein